MNTSIKTIACTAVVSMLLLSCNDTTGLNSRGEDDNLAAKGNELKPPLNDPPPADVMTSGYTGETIVAEDVQKWMEDNIASKSGEKRLIVVSDMYLPNNESTTALSAISDLNGNVKYFLNGKEISAEEYNSKWEEEREKVSGKRNLSIPGEIISGETLIIWISLMTAEELAELLSKNYDSLAIEFYIEPVNE